MDAAARLVMQEGLSYLAAAHRVASDQLLVHIHTCEQLAAKQAVHRQVKALHARQAQQHQLRHEATADAPMLADGKENDDGANATMRGHNRKGNCGRKRQALEDIVPGDKQREGRHTRGLQITLHTGLLSSMQWGVLATMPPPPPPIAA